MTLPQNVEDAVERVNHCELHSFDSRHALRDQVDEVYLAFMGVTQ